MYVEVLEDGETVQRNREYMLRYKYKRNSVFSLTIIQP